MRIRTHTNPLSYKQRFKKLEEYGFTGTTTAVDFEIGFGQAPFILNHAIKNPQRIIVGAEVRKKAVDLLQEKIVSQNLQNILALHGNGHISLEDVFNDHTVDNIFIFHPDPWMKRRHYNRRVINDDILSLAHKKLKATGKLYISTDVESLWDHINEIIRSNGKFSQINDSVFWQELYSTHWTEMCREKQRHIFYGTFTPQQLEK